MANEQGIKMDDDDELHVLLFPSLAHGHISAYAQLSTRLADHGVNVSFFSTPRNIAKFKPFFENRRGNGKIRLLDLPLPLVEGLPPGIESTAQLPLHLTPFFDKALDGLEIPFEKLLEEINPDCVVFDFMNWWAGQSAAKFGIPSISFPTFGAAFTSYVVNPVVRKYGDAVTAEDLTQPPPGFPAPEIAWKLYEARHALPCYKAVEPNTVNYNERMSRGIDVCSALAVKSCEEFEEEFIKYLGEVTGKLVLPLGPLLPEFRPAADADCLRWLDTQEQGSVVYVSFGSQFFLTRDQISEVAAGLEASGYPFLWALHVHESCHVSDSLPEGFEERVGKRGLVTGEWVPQQSVLSHPSTGSFFTHCGWNSVMETLSVGLPSIAAPMQFDQGQNARLVVEKLKAGVEIGRKSDGGFDRDEICKAVRIVMGKEDELGTEVRRKAGDIGEVFKHKVLSSGGSQESCIKRFVEHLRLLKARATNPEKGSTRESKKQSHPLLHCGVDKNLHHS